MGKHFLPAFLIFLIALVGCAGMEQASESDLTIQGVVKVPGFKKDQIYNQVKIYIAENFKSAKAVIEHDDKESGTLIGNGIIKYPCEGFDCVAKGDWKVHFTMRVDTKDEKFRVTFSNLMLSWPARYDSLGYHKAHEGPVWQRSEAKKIRPELLRIAVQIKAYIKDSKGKDDW